MYKIVYLFLFLIVVCLIPWSFGEAATQQQFTLTVTKAGGGSGKVTSSPSGINCGSACSGTFNQGKRVTLKAKADSGSVFTAWGGGCTGTGSCSVVMNSDVTVTATFELKPTTKVPVFSISADSLDFGQVNMGKKVTKTATISNDGTGDLQVTVSGLDGDDFSYSGKSTFTVKPNRSYSLKITCQSTEEATEESELESGDASPVPLTVFYLNAEGTVKMYTNDPAHPTPELKLKAQVETVPNCPASMSTNYTLGFEMTFGFNDSGAVGKMNGSTIMAFSLVRMVDAEGNTIYIGGCSPPDCGALPFTYNFAGDDFSCNCTGTFDLKLGAETDPPICGEILLSITFLDLKDYICQCTDQSFILPFYAGGGDPWDFNMIFKNMEKKTYTEKDFEIDIPGGYLELTLTLGFM